ncbi:MAG: hypothetical protein M3Q27_11530 [Actinomycetota bacterium]|nr:hypothetical protein [Actinomycetota bacterium]
MRATGAPVRSGDDRLDGGAGLERVGEDTRLHGLLIGDTVQGGGELAAAVAAVVGVLTGVLDHGRPVGFPGPVCAVGVGEKSRRFSLVTWVLAALVVGVPAGQPGPFQGLPNRYRVAAGCVDVDAETVPDLAADAVSDRGRVWVELLPGAGGFPRVRDVLRLRVRPPLVAGYWGERRACRRSLAVESGRELAGLLLAGRLRFPGYLLARPGDLLGDAARDGQRDAQPPLDDLVDAV